MGNVTVIYESVVYMHTYIIHINIQIEFKSRINVKIQNSKKLFELCQ